ncbi:hypothetical protein [Streptomyces sp. NBC_00344]|uniref:hypothetical protein n=1 Tax=Streptomyces sp. NBC_00344 TaxID=2975720 RepID=UPI002E1E6718
MDRTPFPDDLVAAQRDWIRTYEALAAPRPCDVTGLRRRLLRLSAQILTHPFWHVSGGRAADRVELHRVARACERTRSGTGGVTRVT